MGRMLVSATCGSTRNGEDLSYHAAGRVCAETPCLHAVCFASSRGYPLEQQLEIRCGSPPITSLQQKMLRRKVHTLPQAPLRW